MISKVPEEKLEIEPKTRSDQSKAPSIGETRVLGKIELENPREVLLEPAIAPEETQKRNQKEEPKKRNLWNLKFWIKLI